MRQQNAYLANMGGGQLQLCATWRPLFKGNVSVAHCMPLSTYCSTKINGSIECKEKKITIFDEYLVLASITSGLSRVINIWMVQYSL